MNATSPLNIARNAAIKCGHLFRSCSKPGFVIFANVGADNLSKVESEIKGADAEIEAIMADGHIDDSELPRLAHAHQLLRGLVG